MDNKLKISVIISTYNSEEWLEKVLWSYEAQIFRDFEVVIADDGSKQPTFDLIAKIKSLVDYPIKHVWHEDKGFQKPADKAHLPLIIGGFDLSSNTSISNMLTIILL